MENKRQIQNRKLFPALLLVMLLLFTSAFLAAVPAAAAENELEYTSEETGYRAVVEDGADLLTSDQEAKILEKMKPILAYGNVAFVTNTEHNYDAQQFAREWFLDNFGKVNGTVFLIDMYNRRLEIFSGQEMYNQISTVRANEITDNIYTYAMDGDYYTCADVAFEQISTILDGGAIVTPMKYATNAAFAAGLVLLVNFIIIYQQRKKRKNVLALQSATVETVSAKGGAVQSVSSVMTRRTSRRHVESSGGGGGFSGGGGGFSGGGGGGGFSGGGGGHGF